MMTNISCAYLPSAHSLWWNPCSGLLPIFSLNSLLFPCWDLRVLCMFQIWGLCQTWGLPVPLSLELSSYPLDRIKDQSFKFWWRPNYWLFLFVLLAWSLRSLPRAPHPHVVVCSAMIYSTGEGALCPSPASAALAWPLLSPSPQESITHIFLFPWKICCIVSLSKRFFF